MNQNNKGNLNFYWETSAVNYMSERFDINDAIVTKAFQSSKGNKYYLSPITIWEILRTKDSFRKEEIIQYCQHLFHDTLLKSPSEFIVNYIRLGCPMRERGTNIHSTSSLNSTWKNLCNNSSLTFIYDFSELEERTKLLYDLSKQIHQIINSINLDPIPTKIEYQYQDLLHRVMNKLNHKDNDPRRIENKIIRISILFILYILCLEMDIWNKDIKDFWRELKIIDPIQRLDYIINNHETLIYRGPFINMAFMAYSQIDGNQKSNRGLFFDSLHSIYLAYTDIFITNDYHFVNVRKQKISPTYDKIFHLKEVKIDIYKRHLDR